MKTRWWSWLVVPAVMLFAGCTGGGNGGLESTNATSAVLYTANDGSNTVSGFTIGTGGALTATNPATVSVNNSVWLTVSQDGQLLYASNQENHTISGFKINSATGNLTSIGTPTVVTGTNPSPRGITITPNGSFAYVANSATNTVAGFSIGTGGDLTPTTPATVATGGTAARGIAVSPNDQFLYVANSTSDTISGFTIGAGGALTAISGAPFPTGAGSNPESLVVTPDNSVLFVVYSGTNQIGAFTIGGGGVLTAAVPTSRFPTGTLGGEGSQRLTLSPNGLFLYVTNTGTNEIAVFSINSGGQLLTRIIPNTSTGAASAPVGITVDPSGRFLYVANSGTNEVAGFSIGTGGGLTPTTPATFSVLPNVPIGIATPARP